MKQEDILPELEKYGFRMIRRDKPLHELIPAIIEAGDLRLFYSIPIVLLNTPNENLNFEAFSGGKHEKLIKELFFLSSLLFAEELVGDEVIGKIREYTGDMPKLEESFMEGGNICLSEGFVLNAMSLSENFRNQLTIKDLTDKLASRMELDLEFKRRNSLSLLFPEKQREIINKKLNRENLTKTEKEYFSRKIKPKLEAIKDPEIQNIARLLA